MTRLFLRLVLISLIGLAAQSVHAQSPYRPTYPRCGGPGPPLPTSNASGDAIYVRVVDSAGNDFEIWCMEGFWSRYYEFRASFPDGTVVKVDECELSMGINDVVLHITGGITNTTLLPNGGKLITVGGVISKYYHENANSSEDFHHIYDYATKTLVRVDTKAATDDNGIPYREILYARKSTLSKPIVSNSTPQVFGTPFDPQPDNSVSACLAGELDSSVKVRVRTVATSEVINPNSTPIEEIQYDEKTSMLSLVLPHTPGRANVVSIAIPRELLPGGVTSIVMVDEKTVSADEIVTPTFRVLNIPIQPESRIIRIEPQLATSGRAPLVLFALGTGGFLLGILFLVLVRWLRSTPQT